MEINFSEVVSLILKSEGGYVDHPKDPGGSTNMGITRKTLAAWRGIHWRRLSKQEVKKLTSDEAKAIYKKNYWDSFKGDDLPFGLDYAVMDYAVNSGVSRSVKALQRLLGVKADGVVGVITLSAINDHPNHAKLVSILCHRRLAWLQRLRHWSTFGKGWAKRVNKVETVALSMVQKTGIEKLDGVAYLKPSSFMEHVVKLGLL